jgi:acyl-CoA reductase-like NAD-dependent aldehyde dehydrogenase
VWRRGRSYEVTDPKGHFLANAAWASRKDARDSVVAARGAFPKWSAMTAHNRGQVLYRVAEVMEGRRIQFCEEVSAGEGLSAGKVRAAVDAAIDRRRT